jgi:glycosyltransferase involved in cell wall biosynthesis
LTLKKTLSIVIPCYNEANKFAVEKYSRFIEQNKNITLLFSNDGSTDHTLKFIQQLKEKYERQVCVINSDKNQGKAEAVRYGINFSIQNLNCQNIAYLDADLATSLEECYELSQIIDHEINFVFGSRIMKIGSTIERHTYRFLIGRIIATFISRILDLKVYDTQCGCKIFTAELAAILFKDKFISKWLFDVELFKRMLLIFGKETALKKMLEIPLKEWHDVGDSKVKFTYFFKLWFDLLKIKNNYKVKK